MIRPHPRIPQKYFIHQQLGRTRQSLGMIPPHTVWKPQPHRLIVDWLEFVLSVVPRGDTTPSLDHKYLCVNIYIILQRIGDEPGDPPPRFRPARCGNPQPRVYCWLGLLKTAATGDETSFYFEVRMYLMQRPGDKGGDPARRYRQVRCGYPSPNYTPD